MPQLGRHCQLAVFSGVWCLMWLPSSAIVCFLPLPFKMSGAPICGCVHNLTTVTFSICHHSTPVIFFPHFFLMLCGVPVDTHCLEKNQHTSQKRQLHLSEWIDGCADCMCCVQLMKKRTLLWRHCLYCYSRLPSWGSVL